MCVGLHLHTSSRCLENIFDHEIKSNHGIFFCANASFSCCKQKFPTLTFMNFIGSVGLPETTFLGVSLKFQNNVVPGLALQYTCHTDTRRTWQWLRANGGQNISDGAVFARLCLHSQCSQPTGPRLHGL